MNNLEPTLQFEGEYNFNTEEISNVYDKRTVSLWFKVEDITSNEDLVIYEENGNTQGLKIYVKDERLFFDRWDRSGNEWSGSYTSSDEIASDTWHHVALAIDRESEREFIAYLDGVDTDRGEGIPADKVDIGVGGFNPPTNNKETSEDISGYTVKDVRVYDKILDESELDAIVNPNHKPEPLSDTAVTIENTEVVLLSSQLLANDFDANGDPLTLKGVGNVSNGKVTINSDGNVIFTPKFGFSGEASFKYIVEDDLGETATTTVTVDVLAETRSVPLGTGLHSVQGVSPELPFINGVKTAPEWLTQDFGVTTDEVGNFVNVWNTGESNLLDLDENGWVKTIPALEDDPQYSSVGMLLYRNLDYYPEGKYVVLYEGEGTLEYSFDAQKDTAASTPGRDVINVNPTRNGIWLRITDTDPNETGEYIRNIQVVPEEYEDMAGEIYNPDFINVASNFDTLNYLSWAGINNSQEIEWSDRPTPDSSIFSEDLVSIEEMVELANQSQTNPWFHIPHQANDEYITNFAEYVAENLDPNLEVYLEYSHEVWNPNYDQARWIREKGEAEWADNDFVGGFGKRLDWYSKRTVEVNQIWDDAFGDDKERVIGIINGQASDSITIERVLNYNWADDPLSNEEYGIDAIALSPDTASYLEDPDIAAEVATWTSDADGGLDKFFTELTEGGLLSTSPTGGAFQQAYDYTSAYADIADREGLDLITYELPQKLPFGYGGDDNQAIQDLFDAAKTDPRMEELYGEYFTTLSESGADLSVNFNDPSAYNQWGSWWDLSANNLENTARLEAVTSLTAKNNHSLSPELGILDNNLSKLNLIVEGNSLEIISNYADVNTDQGHTIEYDWGDNTTDSENRDPLLGTIGDISIGHVYITEGNYTAAVTVIDEANKTATEELSFSVAKKIAIDWKPYSTNQQTDLSGDGTVKVAIFGRGDFAVEDIDIAGIKASDRKNTLLNGFGIETLADDSDIQDVNSDNFPDLILSFDKASLRSKVSTDTNSTIDDSDLYLFGSNSELESGYFLGSE